MSSASGISHHIHSRTLSYPRHLPITFSSLTLTLYFIPHHIQCSLQFSFFCISLLHLIQFAKHFLKTFPIIGFNGAKKLCWFCTLIFNCSTIHMVVKSPGPSIRQTWIQIQAVLLIGYVPTGKLLNFLKLFSSTVQWTKWHNWLLGA